MKSLLVTQDLWSAVITSCKPNASAEEKVAWSVIDQKALASIILSVKPSELLHIKKCTSANSAWVTYLKS